MTAISVGCGDVGKANLVAARANLGKAKTSAADAALTDKRSRGLVADGVIAQAEARRR